MKKTTITFLTAAAALGMASCDQAKQAAADTQAAAKEAAAKAEAAMPGLKEKAATAMESAKDAGSDALDAAKQAGSDALDKTKEMADAAGDWTKEKLGIPEADGMLDGFKSLFAEAKTAISSGMTGEKATALKAKWDELYAKSADTIKGIAPEHQDKLKAVLATIKAKWDELMSKSAAPAAE